MEVQNLKQLIKSNNVPNFLIFTGEEWKVQKIYIEQIAKVKNLDIRYIDSVSEIWQELGSHSLFSQDYLYVVSDDKEFLSEEELYQNITHRLAKNTLILTLTHVDKRLKSVKTHDSAIVEFKTLTDAVLKQYIKREINLSDRNCEILMDITEHNYGRCLLEIDKIKKCMTGTKAEDMPNNIFELLLFDGTIYTPPKDVIFDFIKAVMQRKIKRVYDMLFDLKELQEPTLVIISNLYNLAKQTLQVQSCKHDIAKTTGLSPWQIRNAEECVGHSTNNELVDFMRLLQDTEMRIKTGQIEDSIVIDYILSYFL